MIAGEDGAPPDRHPASSSDTDKLIDALFRKEEPGLRRYFSRRLPADDDPLDYVQEVFTRLVVAMRGEAPMKPVGYLRRIAMNLLVDRHRQRPTIRCAVSVEVAVPPEQEEALLAKDVMQTYQAALAAMTDRTRTVFLLYRVEKMKYREIAERLGISIPAVQKHMARALERITLALIDGD